MTTDSELSFGDFGDSGSFRRRSSGSNLRRVGYCRDVVGDSFGDEEDNDEAAGAGGKRVAAASAPRGGGCAAGSASKSKPSLASVASSRGGTASAGQLNKDHGRKVGSFDGSKSVVLPTPYAPPRGDRYPGSPRRLRRRRGAEIGDVDDVTSDDDVGESKALIGVEAKVACSDVIEGNGGNIVLIGLPVNSADSHTFHHMLALLYTLEFPCTKA